MANSEERPMVELNDEDLDGVVGGTLDETILEIVGNYY